MIKIKKAQKASFGVITHPNGPVATFDSAGSNSSLRE